MKNDKQIPKLPIAELEEKLSEEEWDRLKVESVFKSVLKDKPFEIVWTQNRSRYLSITVKNGVYVYRLHKVFLRAPRNVLEAAAGIALRSTKNRKELLARFIETKAYDEMRERAKFSKEAGVGRWYDLNQIKEKLNQEYFDPPVEVAIRWGRRRSTANKRSVALGTYNVLTDVITIHPVLDSPDVPLYVVEYTVFHEMVHAKRVRDTDSLKAGRRHDAEFKKELERYKLKDKAEEWEKENMKELLRLFKP